MSKEDKLLMFILIVLTFWAGIFIIPRIQKKCSNRLYKSYNRKMLKNKYGIQISGR